MIILDRFEGDYAVIEMNGEIINVERHRLGTEVKEGDVLTVIGDKYYTDNQATEKRKQDIKDKFKDMWED